LTVRSEIGPVRRLCTLAGDRDAREKNSLPQITKPQVLVNAD